MSLTRKQVRLIRNSVLYTILKYSDCIDFSKVPTVPQRYLMKYLITLNDFYSEKRNKK